MAAEAAKDGEAFITAMAGRETASRDARVKVVVSFIVMLLRKKITGGRQCAARPFVYLACGLAVIWSAT